MSVAKQLQPKTLETLPPESSGQNRKDVLAERRVPLNAVIVASLGYFVDAYDLALFSLLRVQSLTSMGLSPQQVLTEGAWILNVQMIGMLIGGFLWGMLADKRGRVQVLYASIALYSVATFATAFVTSSSGYAVWRFIGGVGMAGEIGVGITLVSELLPPRLRGFGTTAVATLGLLGVVVASLVVGFFSWQSNYMIGGALGFALLALRLSTQESALFSAIASEKKVQRGRLRDVFGSARAVGRYLACIAIGCPIWFVAGVLVTFAPEISKALGVTEPVRVSTLLALGGTACALGDVAAGLLSQYLKSRKYPIGIFLCCSAAACVGLVVASPRSALGYYAFVSLAYFFVGYWCILLTTSAEQFGTNVRGTAATSIPNVVRGMTVPITMSFLALSAAYGIANAVLIVAVTLFALAGIGVYLLRESFGTDLSFVE